MPHYKRNIRFLLFLVLPILTFLLGWSLNEQQSRENSPNQQTEIKKLTPNKHLLSGVLLHRKTDPKDVNLDLFWETWNSLEQSFLYPEKLTEKKQVYGAIKGLVNSLEDPYTNFMDPEETAEFEKSIRDEVFEGIGAEIGVRKNQLMIISPLKGSPAELAGLRAGDKIFTIDGKPSLDISAEEAVTKIRGPKGEPVVLEILRKNEDKPIKITIVRDSIVNKSFTWKMVDKIAVIEISHFNEDLEKLFADAIPQILLEKPEGMIIDIRNNGGGLLDSSLKVMNDFFDHQVLVQTAGRNKKEITAIESETGGAFLEIPIVVLINAGSASASEIFAGAFQDYDRGILLGTKTFGKGVVQNVIPLAEGATLKVTIAEWITPKNRHINEKGISPDLEIEQTEEDFDNDVDPVMDKAFNILNTEGAYQKLLDEKKEQASDESAEENEENSEKTNKENDDEK